MIPKVEVDTDCFYVTKHSTWKGRYRRVFSVGPSCISTFNPVSLEPTNRWEYADIIDVQPASSNKTEFTLLLRKDKKSDSLKFSCDYRSALLTKALTYKHSFSEKPKEIYRYPSYKHHWSDTKLPVMLEVTASALNQLDLATNTILASYPFQDIQAFSLVKDCPNGFVIVCAEFSRMHMFSCDKLSELKSKLLELANGLGVPITVLKDPVTFLEFSSQRLGKFSGDEFITSICEFNVSKHSKRHQEPTRRILCLSDVCLLERDPQTYSVCTLRPLSDVYSLVRDQMDPQRFSIEYVNGDIRTYTASDRDSLLATLVDSVRGSGNQDVHVKMVCTSRARRWSPLNTPVEQEVESHHLKMLHQRPPGASLNEAILRFNSNVPYSGLLHSVTQDGLFTENKEKLITNALLALSSEDCEQPSMTVQDLEAHFHALRRLFASKIGFAAFTSAQGLRESIGKQVVSSLKRNDEGVTHAAIDMMCCLLHPMHQEYDIRQEQLNKTSVISNKMFVEKLLDMWMCHINRGTGALVVSAMLDLLTFILCVPFCETTDGKDFDTLLNLVASRGRALFRLFQHTSLAVVKGAGLVMRALIEEGEASISSKMQTLALSEGAFPSHLLTALYTPATDSRLLAHRELSRHLIGLWATESSASMDLLRRILPVGLLAFLTSNEKVPESVLAQERLVSRDNLKLATAQEAEKRGPNWITVERHLKAVERRVEAALMHWGARVGLEPRVREREKKERPIVLRRRRERVKTSANWTLFYYQFRQDHALPHLIWNHKTRDELREALVTQARLFTSDRDLSGNSLISWNHQEFEVPYNCLAGEVKIGEYYLRLLLEKDDNNESPIERSFEFFNSLYHTFLLAIKVEMRCMCLQAMSVVYGRYFAEIGPFLDTKYIVAMLEKCTEKMERDRLLLFLEKLILDRSNAKALLDSNGLRLLVDLLTISHLHTSRAVVPAQSNAIEADAGSKSEFHEWHYQEGGESKGPITVDQLKAMFEEGKITTRTRCWAQGMDVWRSLHTIPQFKWSFLAKGSSVLNESDLGARILNIFIRICEFYPSRDADDAIVRPVPRVKAKLSDSSCLLHIVQLLLTFEPAIVEKVSVVLAEIMKDNPRTSTLYLTGVFYFILMYNGSNVLPIARFLKQTHMQQAVSNEDATASEIVQRSALGPLLPEAMLHFLENHGPEKFAETFLGEFDTPEVIWNREMRLLLIQKIAVHVAEFTPLLRVNTRAPYKWCAIPAIRYPQLEHELFCNMYYLRHLCDTVRFPDWPIKDPIRLLKDVLDAWRKEVEKKPAAMSVDDAYECLGLPRGTTHDDTKVRKAYYHLAHMYHPDKNPDAEGKFEEVNEAYKFLCSRRCWSGDGPNPNNIVLVLQTQSILFSRYSKDLEPYKYAGYPQLVRTIQLETADDQLFSKSAPLLAAASELAYHTVHCSALNAEELRREKGLDALLEAFSRCVSTLSRASKPNEVAVQVCLNVIRCFAVAARFQGCRDKMVEMPLLVQDVCQILYYKHLTKLCAAATECVASLAVDSILQMQLLKAGSLWHLILFMLNYDYTLEEGGVERSEEANQQEVCNKLAKLAVLACGRLGGYLSGDLTSPLNDLARTNLAILLTPYLAGQLGDSSPEPLLKLINSNVRNPYLVWDNGTRAELMEYVTGRLEDRLQIHGTEPTCTDFAFSAHAEEPRVGQIYLRIYNDQPTFPLENPKGVVLDLLEWLRANIAAIDDAASSVFIDVETSLVKTSLLVLACLKNVIVANPGVEMQCIGSFRLLFKFLGFTKLPTIQKGALEVIHGVTRNLECVQDIAASEVLGCLLPLLRSLPDSSTLILDVLYGLVSTTKLVKEAVQKGIVIHALYVFCCERDHALREKSAELLGRVLQDKLEGPRGRIALLRFLPPLLVDAMLESPATAVRLFESTHENPELIWDTDSRERVYKLVSKLSDEFFKIQTQNPTASWTVPDEKLQEVNAAGELIVGGVYVRLFLSNPGWAVRKPKEFLNDLMDKCLSLMSRDTLNVDHLEQVTNALVALLRTQPALAGHVPSFGHLPGLIKHMNQIHGNNNAKSAIQILHQLAVNEACVSAMTQWECISSLKKAMQARGDMIGVACDTLDRLFTTGSHQLVRQALEADLVPFLLTLLNGRLEVDNAAMAKAQIVKTLQSMARNPLYGERVNAILDKSSVWCEFRDQKHDLFISSTPTAGYLTGVPNVAGYLTEGATTTNLIPKGPPPVDQQAAEAVAPAFNRI